jgi:hypothetical protein
MLLLRCNTKALFEGEGNCTKVKAYTGASLRWRRLPTINHNVLAS